jgi:hypothetical protein
MSREEQERHKRKTINKPRNIKKYLKEKLNKIEQLEEINGKQ